MELTEFVQARLADEQAAAEQARWAMQDEWFTTAEDKVDEFVRQMSPARVLAEVAAKRRIVEEYCEAEELFLRDHNEAVWSASAAAFERVVTLLALPYRDHPDYDPAWAPDA